MRARAVVEDYGEFRVRLLEELKSVLSAQRGRVAVVHVKRVAGRLAGLNSALLAVAAHALTSIKVVRVDGRVWRLAVVLAPYKCRAPRGVRVVRSGRRIRLVYVRADVAPPDCCPACSSNLELRDGLYVCPECGGIWGAEAGAEGE